MEQVHHIAKGKNQVDYNYIVFLPDNYTNTDKKKWPLLVFLHGAFERGDDLDIVKRNALPKLALKKDFPFLIIAPQCPKISNWNPHKVEVIIDATLKKYRIDLSRIYLTGLSMGGYATWHIATKNPDRYAAIIPICGGGIAVKASRLKNVPIWAFHGLKDNIIPVQKSEEMVDAVNQKGGNAKLTIYPHAEHDSWTETYNNEEIYSWLLSHQNSRQF